jgi:hypothetical protein
VGFSPGAVQRRILSLLNSCLRCLTRRIIFGKHRMSYPVMSNKIALLKREQGKDRPLDLPHLKHD